MKPPAVIGFLVRDYRCGSHTHIPRVTGLTPTHTVAENVPPPKMKPAPHPAVQVVLLFQIPGIKYEYKQVHTVKSNNKI